MKYSLIIRINNLNSGKMSDKIKALAKNMVDRKRSGTDPYIIFLGAGASIESGCSTMMGIVDDILQNHESAQFDNWQIKIKEATSIDVKYGDLLRQEIEKEKRGKFFDAWNRLDGDSKYSILRKHLWEGKSPSDGYIDLAHLMKMGYIKTILSTNLDNLLEKALQNIGAYSPDDFIVVVNKKDREEEVLEQLDSSRPSLKIVKLHGTLESPRSYAFTPDEIFDFEKNIKPNLSQIINQSLIVIGHSMQDRDIDMLFESEGKEIHFINLNKPEIESRIDNILKVRRQGSIIEGDDGKFDNFFQKLRQHIRKESNDLSIEDTTLSIEGFLRNIGYEHELEVPRSRFKNLPTLYVKPTEYDDVCSKLERDHVVFIIGEPHLGKTYTSFYLLWEYYQKGYEILHIKHDRLISLFHKHDKDMKKLLIDLFATENGSSRIIHFDDPFGETMERRTDEFGKELDTFLDLAHGYEHLRIIVTTRLNIFRESIADVHDSKKVEELEKDIRVHTSYHRDTILDILHRYTKFYNPLWSEDEKIVATLDEQLPDLLPAPHNIEFFVRTSERLTSSEEVLHHVETSKEMVKALGEWMASLPEHEQLFLIWMEVCSTTSMLFPNTPASKMQFEDAYMETLAFMFKKKHMTGISPSPFSHSKDKFDMILLESRDEENDLVKYDFVHPSYHEAFWYTIHHKLHLHHWWDLLKKNIGEIFQGVENKVDLVQLRMIERYGTINRDLDQLLLISAESNDINEQLIALEHMLERYEQFADFPQFSNCVCSVTSSGKRDHVIRFLELVDKYIDLLPLDVLNKVPSFLFYKNRSVYKKAKEILSQRTLSKSVRKSEAIRTWELINNITDFEFSPFINENGSIDEIHTEPIKKSLDFFSDLSLTDIQLLFKNKCNIPLKYLISIADKSWNQLSSEQREIIKINDFLNSDNENIANLAKLLVVHHHKDFMHLSEKYSFIKELNLLHKTLNIPFESSENVILRFELMIVDDWKRISPKVLKKLINSTLPNLTEIMVQKFIENYYNLSEEQRQVICTLQPDNSLVVKQLYRILPNFLIILTNYSEVELIIKNLINAPTNWWVAGSIGQLTRNNMMTLNKVEDLIIMLSNYDDKRIVGSLLAEMAQIHFDKKMGLQEMYDPILYKLSRDSEAVRYAEEWMDYQLESFNWFDNKYWSKVKAHLHNLS